MQVDSTRQLVGIPQDKREKAMVLLKYALDHKKVLVHRLQKLTGTLNFMCRGIVPGRAYTRQIYRKYAGLKQYDHVKVDRELQRLQHVAVIFEAVK